MLSRFFICLIIFVGQGNAQFLSDSSLVCYYSFTGNADDNSENALHGIPVNTVLVEDINNIPNSAYYFNSIESFISLPSSNKLKVSFPFSFSCWVKLDEYGVPIFTNDFEDNIYSGILFFISSQGKFAITIGNGGPIGFNSRHSKVTYNSLNLNQWSHVACVARDFNDIDLYLNGELEDGYYDGGGNSLIYTNGNGSIGLKDQDLHGPPTYFHGILDEILFFEKALETQEVKNLYNSIFNFIKLEVPDLTASVGDTIKVPFNIELPSNYEINSMEVKFIYPVEEIIFKGINVMGSMLENADWIFSVNETDTTTNISGAGSKGVSENGCLLFLEFVVANNIYSNLVKIEFNSALFNDDIYKTNAKSGTIIIGSNLVKGDVDFDNKIHALDASHILKYLVEVKDLTLDQIYAADVSLDSTVSALDAKLILDYTTHLIDTLPYVPSPNLKYAVGGVLMPNTVVENSGLVVTPIIIEKSENIISFQGEILFNANLYTFDKVDWGENFKQYNIEINEINGSIKFAGFGKIISDSQMHFGDLHLTKRTNSFSVSPILFRSIQWNEDVKHVNVARTIIDITTKIESNNLQDYGLEQNYPNPFNPVTRIEYSIPSSSFVTLKIYDVLGSKIATLVNERLLSGAHSVTFNAAGLNSGVYFYRIESENFVITKKMILMK